MTMFRSGGKQYEWTLLIDAFNNEILAQGLRQAGRQQTLLPRLRRIAAAFEVKEREDRPHRFPQRPRGSSTPQGLLQSL